MEAVYVVLLGFLIDLALGDPSWMPHPHWNCNDITLLYSIVGRLYKSLAEIYARGILVLADICG